jgi:Na+-transporting methylmalonyl-CoA/oxaloacetate decarboxylase gamma subunit
VELADALTVTALGMGVVFSGLILTATLIVSFSVLPKLLDRAPAEAAASPRANAAEAVRSADGRPVPPEVVGVITAVLEIERRLYHADLGGRLTIQRPERAT